MPKTINKTNMILVFVVMYPIKNTITKQINTDVIYNFIHLFW